MSPDVPQILILEDNEQLLKALAESIRKWFKDQIEILTAKNVDEAEALLESERSTLAVFVTDVIMPDGKPGGLDLAIRLAPKMAVIVMSAFPPSSFERQPEQLGPVTFIEKSSKKEFREDLIAAIEKEIRNKRFSARVGDESDERDSRSIHRKFGAILAVRFRLPNIQPVDLPKVGLRNLDFASIAFGTRELQASIERQQGRIHSLHDQTLWASFLDGGDNQECVRQAIEAFCETCKSMDGEWKAGFEDCPFGAAVVPGMLVSGLFGRYQPGMSAIVGRLGDVAQQLTMRTLPREIAVVPEWLTPRRRKWFKQLPGSRRVDTFLLADLASQVEVEFYRP